MRREKRMSEADKAIVRACLEQIDLVLEEAREVRTWWSTLSEDNRQEWKDFAASVSSYRLALRRE
jgi:hypothetical protein